MERSSDEQRREKFVRRAAEREIWEREMRRERGREADGAREEDEGGFSFLPLLSGHVAIDASTVLLLCYEPSLSIHYQSQVQEYWIQFLEN